MTLAWDRARISLEGLTVFGVDEIAGRLAIATSPPVYQLDAGRRRLQVSEERKIEILGSVFRWFGTKGAG